MSAIIRSEMISRRKALSLMGLAAAFGLAAAPTALTVSDAEAQTAAAPTAAQALLMDQELIEGSWCRKEYAELALAWFPSLPNAMQRQTLDLVDSIANQLRDRWRRAVSRSTRKDRPRTRGV